MSILLLVPRCPTAFKELVSQFKLRKSMILQSPVFEVPKEFHGLIEDQKEYMTVQHLEISIVGSYENRVLWRNSISAYRESDMSPRDWLDRSCYIVKVSDERFVIFNWPKLKVRPFPDEQFHLSIRFPQNHRVNIPYYPTKL